MRSMIASILAALLVAAHAPLAPLGGAGLPSRPSGAAMSCCGAKACCVHGHPCATSEACALTEAAPASASARDRGGRPRIHVGACGSESARLVPRSPDPGTLEPGIACSGDPSIVRAVAPAITALPTGAPKPAEPPPRA